MWRLMIVTFGCLGWAFYVLSGGADYQPSNGSRQHAALAGASQTATAQQQTTQARRPAAPAAIEGAQLVLASASADNASPTAPSSGNKRLRLTLNTQNSTNPPAATPGVATVAADPDKIARLVAAANTVRPAPQPQTDTTASADDGRDLRKVKSARVNMRQGPGKDFNVVAKLTRGTAVEVLRDDGTGWVKLRVADTGRVGWMADFLLVAAN